MMKSLKTIIFATILLLCPCRNYGEQRSEYAHKIKSPKQVLKIVFVGDICFGESYRPFMTKDQVRNIFETESYDYSIEKLAPLLQGNNLVIGNLETTVTDLPHSLFNGKKKYLNRGDIKKTPAILKKHNFGAVSLANNHTLDFGLVGLLQTQQVLKENGIRYLGAGIDETKANRCLGYKFLLNDKPFKLILTAGFEYRTNYDKEFHYYANSEGGGVSLWEENLAKNKILFIRKNNPDAFIVAYPHWGENYTGIASQQRLLAHTLINAGADIVIGHGAHVMQGIEYYHGRWIIYSLGNFVFNSPGRYAHKKVEPFSLAARMEVTEKNNKFTYALRLYPIFSDNLITNYQPRFVDENEINKVSKILLPNSNLPEGMKKFAIGQDDLGFYIPLNVIPGENQAGK